MDNLKDFCNRERESIKNVAYKVKDVADSLKKPSAPEVAENEDRGEEIANLMLAYRHLEDARMRLGKVIQAMDGGVSVYDKKEE